MPQDNVIKLIQPRPFDDQLTKILRNGARALLATAVEAEIADFLGKHADLKTEDGQRRVSGVLSADQNSSGALSTTSFITKNVRVCRTPGSAINWSPWMRLKSAMSSALIFRK